MADFSVNASNKNIPPTNRQDAECKVECDSAGENCYCPTNNNFDEEVGYRGNKIDEFNPIVPILQAVGFVNVLAEATFGDGISAPKSTPELSKPKTPRPPTPDSNIDEDAYDSFSLALTPPSFWAGSVFENFGGGEASPEERGQFAALNFAANFNQGRGLPDTRIDTSPNFDLIQSWNNISYSNFSISGTQLGVE
jgi:hypothetical protein